ncbi:uncharacterized protein LOC106080605 [Stomoxys calcitrans]|uniref:uncharacterized protein LOC106080605 n=1 Tax=Stomoxys calcitrans TaxID=35570 RepID=UPI0027E36728|nr:uncharacterized protein LOC106080605 [Stomoxys calcitrans]
MTKLLIGCIFVSITLILGERPEWYPKNASLFEKACLVENGMRPDQWARIRTMHLEDTPSERAFLLCLVKTKNVFRPEKGFEAERLRLGFQQSIKMDCDIEHIEHCKQLYGHLKPDDVMVFQIMKCVCDVKDEKCRIPIKNEL